MTYVNIGNLRNVTELRQQNYMIDNILELKKFYHNEKIPPGLLHRQKKSATRVALQSII
jgi:hypothetical protein